MTLDLLERGDNYFGASKDQITLKAREGAVFDG